MSFSFTKSAKLYLLSFLVFFISIPAVSAQGVTVYTPYTKIVVPPGETLDYSVKIKNNENAPRNLDLYITGLPYGWTYELKAKNWDIKRIYLLPGDEKSISLKVNIPYKVKKGTYKFNVVAGSNSLPLYVVVSKQGNYKTEFTCKQNNMQGSAKSNFTFGTTLKNVTGERQRYAFHSSAPRGWQVKFKPNYKQATSVELDPNQKVNVAIEIKPPYNIKEGTYKIPVSAVNSNTSSELTLEVAITGTYDMELTTPSGLLSGSLTAGDVKKVKLLVRNTGSSKLENIKLSSSAPKNWDVTFSHKNIEVLQPGKNTEVTANIMAYKKAIAGDYVTKITASTPEASSKMNLRLTVKTSILVGWIGIFIILLAIGGIYFLFKKYGRR